jgi:hypothetical protein
MAEEVPCSCGCGKLVSALTDHRHHAGMTTPHAKATCLTSQSITGNPSRKNSHQRKRQRTNLGRLPPLKIQDRGTIHTSGSSVNDVPPTADMAVDMENMNPPLPPLLPNYSETESIEPVVNSCAEAWTNASRYWATVEESTKMQILIRNLMERRAEHHLVNLRMGEIVHHQYRIALMTPLMMNLIESWVILVRILTCLLPRNLVIMY